MNPKQQKAIVQQLVYQELKKKELKLVEETAIAVIAATLLVLQSKHQFTAYSLNKVKEQIFEQFNLVLSKYVKIEDFYKELEGMGIQLVS